MESSLLKCFWVSLLVLLFQLQSCLGCLEKERIALLEFKAQLDLIDPDDGFGLPSWVDEKGSDCCSWELVKCNATTNRVIQLSLFNIQEFYSGETWYLNVTLFSAFEELQHLNLSSNGFDGWIKNEGFERLVGLRKLEVLDLSNNNFNYSILPSLGALTSLRTLSLRNNDLKGSVVLEELATLHNLQTLDLSGNYLQLKSTQTKQGFNGLVGLKKLEFLNLDRNFLGDSIFLSLGGLTSLKTLSLGDSNFQGSVHWEELAKLHNLQSLDLSYNLINTSLQTIQELVTLHNLQTLDLCFNNLRQASTLTNQGFKRLIGLKRLEVLYLGGNNFNNSILPSLGAFTSITTLSFVGNSLEGSSNVGELTNLRNLISLDLSGNALNASSHTIEALCKVKSLQELDLSGNNFEGILPPCLQNLTSLRKLDLSHNQFKGNIPSNLLSNLTSLVHISLSYNDFEGIFTFHTFANNSQLEMVDLSSGGNKLEVETEYPLWIPPFQLKVLLLSNCNLNQKTNIVPNFLSNQYQLREVDLSHNNLKGKFPTWLLENNKMLSSLTMRSNALTGHFSLPSNIHKFIHTIDISNNCIDGLLQENIGKKFPYLHYLNLSTNCFEGGIPLSIGHMKLMSVLDMSNNNFIGEFPDHITRGCINLFFLKLSYNRLHGQLFHPHFNFTRLFSLHLDNNLFSGDILNGLSKCSELEVLDIGNNGIIGRLPSWIENCTNLSVFNMQGNLLEGNIPIEIKKFNQLFFLDLSHNHLSGSIPLLNSTRLQHLHLQGNGFTGFPPITLINNSNLLTLDMRGNNLHGDIPNWIGGLSSLKILLLKGNHLHGPIPNYMCQLSQISIMDLSQNTLFGSIPRCFNNITFGRTRNTNPVFQQAIFVHLEYFYQSDDNFLEFGEVEGIEFITKNRSDSYKGNILNFMSGLDLSCNNLSSEIPHEIGDLSEILALNFSHNQLTASIPKSLANLTQIESLDLSHNKLSKEIPSELTTLYNLEVFTVAYNNLSGKTPEMKAQFATFETNSYEGNPFLCGPPLPKNCLSILKSTNTSETSSNGVKNDGEIDIGIFYASFAASYVMCLLGFAAVLYINPYWRRAWFYFIENCIHSLYDIVTDTWYKLSIYVLN